MHSRRIHRSTTEICAARLFNYIVELVLGFMVMGMIMIWVRLSVRVRVRV